MRKLILFAFGIAMALTTNAQVSFSIDDTDLCQGETKKIEINMANDADVIAYQFEVEVPTNVTIATSGKGVRPEITDWTDTHSVSAQKQSDGSYRFLVSSPENEIYSKGSGAILKINITANTNAPVGSYKLAIKNITVSLDGSKKLLVDNTTWNCTVCGEYSRTTTSGNYGTICLPWNVKLSDVKGAEIYSINGKVMSGANPSSIIAEAVEDELVAGVPYIFKATAHKIPATYSTDPVSIAGSCNGLVGTFTDLNNIAGKYVIANNKIGKCAAGSTCSANRAYIDMDQVSLYNASEASGKRLVTIGVGEDATAIDAVEAVDGEYEVYSVSGVRMNTEAKGINILKSKLGTKKILK